MKYCKDCKWCRPDRIIQILSLGFVSHYEYATCCRPRSGDLVSGELPSTFCRTERMNFYTIDCCGVQGKYWEAKE